MKLAIADPPYLGYASMWYGDADVDDSDTRPVDKRRRPHMGGVSGITPPRKANTHPDAHEWDKPATHRDLVERLCAEYDGWGIAMNPGNLTDYLTWTPQPYRIAVWVKPNAMPTNSRPIRSWEPVLVRVPDGRRRPSANRSPVRDYLVAAKPATGFAGAKPASWTRWVLDMLGYDPAVDTVEDLFPGSGAVSAAIAQGVLL